MRKAAHALVVGAALALLGCAMDTQRHLDSRILKRKGIEPGSKEARQLEHQLYWMDELDD
jgi:hypothetical protein